jgi:hypothetical protein
MRTSKARTGLRARLACHRRWSVYGSISLPWILKVGAVCGKAARTVLCGGRDENRVPTATGVSSSRCWAARRLRGRSRRARSTRRCCRLSGTLARPRLQPKATWLPPLCSGCANLAGLRVVLSRSSIAGRRVAPSASTKSQPSSSGARLMSLSHQQLRQSWLPSRRRRSSR